MELQELQKIAQFKINDILSFYQTKSEGLTEDEANHKLKKFGLNLIYHPSKNFWIILKDNLSNFFNLLLILASLLSLIVKGPEIETLVIFFFFVISLAISTWQDWKTEKLIENLEKNTKFFIQVKRNGKWVKKESSYLVPGDYVRLQSGDIVPADIFISQASDCFVDESTFTGESEPQIKQTTFNLALTKLPTNILLHGTYLLSGQAEGWIIATGNQTFFGNIIKKTLAEKKETAYKKIMNLMAKDVSLISTLIIFLVLLINLLARKFNIQELLIFLILTFVAAVPEFLPLITTLILSFKTNKLSKKGVLFKRISSIEDLGAVEVLCTDKTGTITEGKLTLNNIFATNLDDFVYFFTLPGILTQSVDPYEQAVLEKYQPLKKEAKLIEDMPFNPEKRKEESLIQLENKKIKIVKGAPEVIFNEFLEGKNLTQELTKWQKEDANGLRTLALGIYDGESKIYLGFASFNDPLKKDTLETFNLAKKLNLDIKILTGDSVGVTQKIAQEIGILKPNDKILTGEEIRQLDEPKLLETVLQHNVFARLLPEDKFKIINALQKKKFVAFLGEGINDILAIKKANVSLVVENAPPASQQEADIVLKMKSLKLIVESIKEGRKTLENIEKYIRHTLVGNFGNLITLSFLAIFSHILPLTPIQIILTNILSDFVMVGIVTDNVPLHEIKQPSKFYYFKNFIVLLILGIVIAMELIYIFLINSVSPNLAQTSLFLATTLIGILIIFSLRTKSFFFSSKPSLFLFISLILTLVLTFLFLIDPFKNWFNFTSLPSESLIEIISLTIVTFLIVDILKVLSYRLIFKLF